MLKNHEDANVDWMDMTSDSEGDSHDSNSTVESCVLCALTHLYLKQNTDKFFSSKTSCEMTK